MRQTTSRVELGIPLAHIDTTIPAGMTIPDYRHSRPQRTSGCRRLRGAASG